MVSDENDISTSEELYIFVLATYATSRVYVLDEIGRLTVLKRLCDRLRWTHFKPADTCAHANMHGTGTTPCFIFVAWTGNESNLAILSVWRCRLLIQG